MKKEYDLKKMKFKRRKPISMKDSKVSITIRFDADLVIWLRQESDKTGIPYQTLLNAKLREAMNLPDRMRELAREIIKEELKKVS